MQIISIGVTSVLYLSSSEVVGVGVELLSESLLFLDSSTC